MKEDERQAPAGFQNPWESRDFIERWSERNDRDKWVRETQLKMAVFMIPHPRGAAIRILDIGAGYGALAAAILDDRPSASAVCVDASAEMIKMGRERNRRFGDRIEFLHGALDDPSWCALLKNPFDAVVSSRALHHLTLERRRNVFRDIYGLLRPGGCFINADTLRAPGEALQAYYRSARKRWDKQDSDWRQNESESRPAGNRLPHGPHYNGSLEEELDGLKQAGFKEADCFWKFTTTAVYGGFR